MPNWAVASKADVDRADSGCDILSLASSLKPRLRTKDEVAYNAMLQDHEHVKIVLL